MEMGLTIENKIKETNKQTKSKTIMQRVHDKNLKQKNV